MDNKLIKSDETLYNGVMDNQQNVEVTESLNKPEPDSSWKQVVMGGATGILIGSLGSALLKPVPAQAAETEEVEESSKTANVDEQPVIYSDAPVAYSVNDNMSFNEAFAAARSEVGPGGVFSWHGGVYGTYYANEWANMDNAARNDFAQSVHQSPTPYHPDNYYAQHSSSSRPAQSHIESSDDDAEVRVLGVEHVSTPTGRLVEVAAVEIDGERAALIDVDNDGIVDGLIADANHDGRISGDEIYDVEHMDISMDELRIAQEQSHFSSYEDPNAGNSPDTYLDDFGA